MSTTLCRASRRAVPSTTPSSFILSRRSVHKLLPYTRFEPAKGYRNFLSPTALKRVAVDYQQGLLDRLNDQVRGTPLEHETIMDTMLAAKNDPALSLTFDYASLAMSNSFFLNGLCDPSKTLPGMEAAFWSKQFEHYLDLSFGLPSPKSVPITEDNKTGLAFEGAKNFQTRLHRVVADMDSSGWIWIVQRVTGENEVNRIEIVTTYGSGTVLVPNRRQVGWGKELGRGFVGTNDRSSDKYRVNIKPSPNSSTSSSSSSVSPARAFSTSPPALLPPRSESSVAWSHTAPAPTSAPPPLSSSLSSLPPYAPPKTRLYPLACLSMHERVWLDDYPMDRGADQRNIYVSNWLMNMDWLRVWQRCAKAPPMTEENSRWKAKESRWD